MLRVALKQQVNQVQIDGGHLSKITLEGQKVFAETPKPNQQFRMNAEYCSWSKLEHSLLIQ